MANDIILKLTGRSQGKIEGESSKKDHIGEIDILSVNWGMVSPGSSHRGGGGGTGEVSFSDVSFTKAVDASSNGIQLALLTGEVITEAIIVARKQGGGQQEFLTIKLKDAVVTNYSISMGAGGEPHESFSLNEAKYEFIYKIQKADGSLGGGRTVEWDIKEGA